MHTTLKQLFHILFFQIIDPWIDNFMEKAMETNLNGGSENPTQIQTENDTETFTKSDKKTTGKSLIRFLK